MAEPHAGDALIIQYTSDDSAYSLRQECRSIAAIAASYPLGFPFIQMLARDGKNRGFDYCRQ